MKRTLPAVLSLIPLLSSAEPLENAEVRLPYSELLRLLDERKVEEKPAEPVPLPPALASARLKIGRDGGRLVLDAAFRTVRFSEKAALVPLIGGELAIERSEPADLNLLMSEGKICHATSEAGSTAFTVRLLADADSATLDLPPCPSLILEAAEGGRYIVSSGGREQTLVAGQALPLPASGGAVSIRMPSERETVEAQRPPQPSDWSWQHQALLRDEEGELAYRVVARASATKGSGLSAELILPADARELKTEGDDLASSRISRDADGALRLLLEWKTRDLLEREIILQYRRPLKPLDAKWQLAAPQGGEGVNSRSRFLIAANPRRAFEGTGLGGPFDPAGLPEKLRGVIGETSYFSLESDSSKAELTARELPLLATAEAVIPEANWQLRQEGDGAILLEAALKIEHRQPLRVPFESPAGYTLLNCSVNGRDSRPIDRGDGKLEIPLPAAAKDSSSIALSFTTRTTALDAVSGILELKLPRTPLFIRTLVWRIDLPAAYGAEVHGNLNREPLGSSDPPSSIRLRKNLCRDEVPAISVFYQRNDLAGTVKP